MSAPLQLSALHWQLTPPRAQNSAYIIVCSGCGLPDGPQGQRFTTVCCIVCSSSYLNLQYSKRRNFRRRKISYNFPYKTFRMELNFVLSEWLKKVKTRDDRKVCKPGGRKFGMEINFVLFLFYESYEKKEICSISSRSRVLAHRPCPKLEMFCPSVLQLFYGCSKVLMTNHGMSFFCFCFLFFKPAGDPSSATLVPDLANQVWPFKSALFKTSRPGKRSWLTREASATERHGNDRLSKRAVHTIR